jgi:ASC-1-like (ASCH) protein
MTTLKFREIDRDIYDAILDGNKKIETRAGTEKFTQLKKGDKVLLICGNDQTEKMIQNVERFESIDHLLSKYEPQDINPKISTREDLIKWYHSFPNYKEKIEKYGLVAMEFE